MPAFGKPASLQLVARAFIAIFFYDVRFPIIFVLAAVIGWVGGAYSRADIVRLFKAEIASRDRLTSDGALS